MEIGVNICAVVVTYNRKVLLQECLQAILAQTQPVARVVVVDNASTDGTGELFQDGGAFATEIIRYVRLPENVGGAGGFHHGLDVAYRSGSDWFWLMDDDTIPRPNALEELIRCREAFPAGQKPRLLASKVEWTDGTLHSMNFPTIRRAALDPERAVLAAQHRALSLRWATFVSVLLHRSAVAEHGLPVADYFIWNDDTEYTARVLRHQFGVLVPASVVVHKTVKKHSAFDAAPARSYYQVRNVLWMVLRSSAWASDERVKILLIHLRWITQYLRRQRFSGAAIAAVAKGVRDGLLRVPQN